ncbi:MAG: F390 synthetase-related protein [Granulosicoccus sp.]
MADLSLYARLTTARAFIRTRYLSRRLRSRADIERWQARRLMSFLQVTAPRVEAFSSMADQPLSAYPTMDKVQLMNNFHQYNRYGITADAGWQAFNDGQMLAGCHVGASTGTSGNRSLYLVNNRERYEWLGIMLAKCIPDILSQRHRVAIMLPANSSLYDAANDSGRVVLRFFDLHEGIDAHFDALQQFSPTIIVAPPKVLRVLAEAALQIRPDRLFSGAEVLDPNDRAIIESHFRITLGEIYMATEGLFAVACQHGSLHLAEDAVKFEWEDDPEGGPLAAPIVTDFSRRTQVMIRYRMNDLLQLSDTPCACGSALQAVTAVVGRMDDVFLLPAAHGSRNNIHDDPLAGARDGARKEIRTITPDVIRNTVLGADRSIDDFRVVQTGRDSVKLILAPGCESQLKEASCAMQALFNRLAVTVNVTSRCEQLPPPASRKLRRVERQYQPDKVSSTRNTWGIVN